MINDADCSIFEAILSLETVEDCQAFFEELLSPRELDKVQGRFKIMLLLYKGYKQREISSKLGVGIATISRGNRILNKKNSIYKIIKKLVNKA